MTFKRSSVLPDLEQSSSNFAESDCETWTEKHGLFKPLDDLANKYSHEQKLNCCFNVISSV